MKLKLTSDSKVFIVAPAGWASGGPELLHQLADYLNRNGQSAYMVYSGGESRVPEPYTGYRLMVAEQIDDREDNVVVVCETMVKELWDVQHAQKVLWWLSFDFFYNQYSLIGLRDLFCWNRVRAWKELFKRPVKYLTGRYNIGRRMLTFESLKDEGILHACQSEYARQCLLERGLTKTVMLRDYINDDYLEPFDEQPRRDAVLYNPSKGLAFTRKLQAAAPDIEWVALSGMTRQQVVDLMHRSKVYIDFGFHPGKDRFPREAAVSGLCIITGRQGSANFFEDVSIGDEFKFADSKDNIPQIVAKIRRCLADYETETLKFADYRARISREKKYFEREVNELFGIEV